MNVEVKMWIQKDSEKTTLLFEGIEAIWFDEVNIKYQQIFNDGDMEIEILDNIDKNIMCELNSHDKTILNIRRLRFYETTTNSKP